MAFHHSCIIAFSLRYLSYAPTMNMGHTYRCGWMKDGWMADGCTCKALLFVTYGMRSAVVMSTTLSLSLIPSASIIPNIFPLLAIKPTL